MNTINTKRLAILGFGVVFLFVGFISASQQTSQDSTRQKVDKITKKGLTPSIGKPSGFVNPSPNSNKSGSAINLPVEKPFDIDTYWEPTEIVRETFVEDEYYDEFTDEAASFEFLQKKRESMSDEERAAKEKINTLEDQLMMETDDLSRNDEVQRQLVELFAGEDEQSNRLRDLKCAQPLCRIVLEVSDEAEQYATLDSLPDQIDWLQKSYAEVHIQPDDSRMVTVYLLRPEVSGVAENVGGGF